MRKRSDFENELEITAHSGVSSQTIVKLKAATPVSLPLLFHRSCEFHVFISNFKTFLITGLISLPPSSHVLTSHSTVVVKSVLLAVACKK